MKDYSIDGGRIRLYTEYAERHRAAAIPGRRWITSQKCWSYPATPAVWARIIHAFPELANEENELARQLARRREVRSREPATEPDYECNLEPWAHQVEATRFARDMDACLLDCWMSAGKTKMAFDAIAARGHEKVLVLCPTAAIDVWEDEAAKHDPVGYHILALNEGSVPDRAGRLREGAASGGPIMAVLNYEASWREPMDEAILSVEWDCLVMDESHRVKSPGAKQARFAARIQARHKIALTGTPMPHSPLDLYGQYRVLDPGIFGTSFTRFRARYAVMGGFEGRQVLGFQNEAELRRYMDSICYHVPKDELDLPEIQFIRRPVTLEPRARRIYTDLEENLIAGVEDGVVTAANALAKLVRLQQVTSGWVPVERAGGEPLSLDAEVPDNPELIAVSDAKHRSAQELLDDLGAGEPVVVFCRFTRDLQAVRGIAEGLDRTYDEISGGSRGGYRRWQEGNVDILGVQLQAGGVSIDLTRARFAVFYSLGYSLGDYQQCIARIHRTNQDHPVAVYHLLAKGTVDEKIMRALDSRRRVIESILSEIKEATHAGR